MKLFDSLSVFGPGDVLGTMSRDGSVVQMFRVGDQGQFLPYFDGPIEALELTVRAYNVLKREGVHTVNEMLIAYDNREQTGGLLSFRNLGEKGFDDIESHVRRLRGIVSG